MFSQPERKSLSESRLPLRLSKWVIPEKIHTSPTDGRLEILAGGVVEGFGNPGGRAV